MRNYGYRVYHKKTFKEKARDFVSILIFIIVILGIFFILWNIPIVKDYIESNKIFKAFIDAFFRK